jgi:5'-nucleotidase
MTLGDILEILPFEDPIILIEIDGATIWDALEASLETWPAQEGLNTSCTLIVASTIIFRRFPVISGFRVQWDSRRSPGQRVLGIWLLNEIEDSESGHHPPTGGSTPRLVDGQAIERTAKKFKIVTRQYMADGHDGFTALTRGRSIIDDEGGQLASAIVRKYLMGNASLPFKVQGLMQPRFTLRQYDGETSCIRYGTSSSDYQISYRAGTS